MTILMIGLHPTTNYQLIVNVYFDLQPILKEMAQIIARVLDALRINSMTLAHDQPQAEMARNLCIIIIVTRNSPSHYLLW